MTLFLDEACVRGLVGMEDALGAVEEVFGEMGRGGVTNVPRVRAPLGDGTLRITAAVLAYRGYYGVKVSSTTIFESSAGRVFSLYKIGTGELSAIVQVFAMGALRTGAASGIATKYMAKVDARILGVIGSGRQARTQVDAVSRVRDLTEVRVFSRSEKNRRRFCTELVNAGLPAHEVGSSEEAARGSDIIITATTSTEPVLKGEWLSPGVHVNAVGANYEYRRELDTDVIARAATIAVDDPEQAQYEATDLVAPVGEGVLDWDTVSALGDIVASNVQARKSDSDITLFKSLGVAFEDVALAACAYERALDRGVGQKLPNLAG